MKTFLLLSAFFILYSLSFSFANQERICTMEYDPVCGVDGVTYVNDCGAGDIGIAYKGECKKQKKETDKTNVNLENCESYFDGCNTCFVKNGKIGGCTRKACFKKEEPKCLKTKNENKKEIIGIANPASVFCKKLGGRSDLKNGNCILGNEEYNERKLFRFEIFPKPNEVLQKKLKSIIDKYFNTKTSPDLQYKIAKKLKEVINQKLSKMRYEEKINLTSMKIFTFVKDYVEQKQGKYCKRSGGERKRMGMMQSFQCNMKAKDAGNSCTDNSQCEGLCLGTGFCSEKTINFGCIESMHNGEKATICID